MGAEGDCPIPAELFDDTGELDLDYIFCSKCKLNHADDVSLPRLMLSRALALPAGMPRLPPGLHCGHCKCVLG